MNLFSGLKGQGLRASDQVVQVKLGVYEPLRMGRNDLSNAERPFASDLEDCTKWPLTTFIDSRGSY